MTEPVPPQLAKKVMLLIHFEAHLKGLSSQRASPKLASALHALEPRLQPLETLRAPGPHVHRYLHTEAAHVFRLSNRTLQVAMFSKPSFSTSPAASCPPCRQQELLSLLRPWRVLAPSACSCCSSL